MATNHQHDSERAPGTTPAKRTRAKKPTTTAGGAAAQTPAPVADPIAQIDEILAAELQRANVIEPQMRMLLRALRDCGLGVSTDDVQIDETTRRGTISLSWSATKRLTSDLQDIAEERPVVVVAPPDGPTLFEIGRAHV